MEEQQRLLLAEEGIRFFGKVSAVISHEVKNVLAIINENNGLLEDFVFMARETGRELEPVRVTESAAAIGRQVKRADAIIKKMNRFAHSTDEKVMQVDLGEELGLFTALAERVATGKEIRLRPAAQSMSFTTSPFHLLHLLWRCLDFILQSARPGTELELSVDSTIKNSASSVQFVLSWQTVDKQKNSEVKGSFPGVLEQALLEALGGDLHLDRDNGRLEFHIASQAES